MSEEEKNKRAFDKIVTDEAIQSLNDRLNDSTFKSSTRIMILVLLTLARKMSAVQLRTLTGLGKGSLENHLNRLENTGYVRVSREKVLGERGVSRQMVEITEKGIDACRALVKSISNLAL